MHAVRYLRRIGVASSLALATSARVGAAVQARGDSLFQLEVTDSIGLPLPNAKLELFTFMEGGVWREWVTLEAYHLEPGMHLLRFSHEGYRASTFSVPLEKGRRGGRSLCATGVIVNGNPTRTTSFARFEETYWASEPEVIEIVTRANAIPFSFRRADVGDCAMLLIWLRGR